MKVNLTAILFFILFTLNSPAQTQAARTDRIDSDQRLELLNQATGNSSAPAGSFQSRLNAIMDTSASPQRISVAYDDTQARTRVDALAKEELIEDELEEEDEKSPRVKTKDQTKVDTGLVKLKDDQSEAAFQKTRDSIQEDFDKRLQKASESKKISQTSAAKKEESELSPSLANNPFYFSSEKRETLFKERKTVIVSRLMASVNMTAADAESLVSQSSSYEELILQLMQEHNLTYGEASDLVS